MLKTLKYLAIGVSASALMAGSALAEKIIIGHFGNPTPMQLLASSDALQQETGWEIEWRKFAAGTDVIAAMASGDVVLSELGSSPLAIAASQGVDLQLIAFSDVIGKAESLIAHEGSGIASTADLKGKRIAVPVGSTAHFSLMGALQHEGIAEADVTIMNMPPDQIAAAWEQGVIDAAWIWQPVQSEILKTGTFVLGADQTAEWGFPTFDGWVVDREFGQANKDKIVAFLKAIDQANASYLKDPAAWTVDSAEVETLATATGADPAQVPEILEGFTFLPMATQVSDTWLGGAGATIKGTADFLKSAGRIDAVVDDYSGFVNAEYAEAAK
ncbi:taurine ABC transporter substrate-binding protein [Albidovulum sediminis]|uniref:Taurine ABC transporter substrate-binding protein n=1 Tax=Albidovulum sediminis TaxID=3066345 RepID=A0ABT2NNX1_9RHOB|nr:taurine ABC transporter substrate-binding protein [Defluviimonas sediminis]MCT8330611.1 taurine ABC transporter substrate-binding protein [Defluviimonas sediminis]